MKHKKLFSTILISSMFLLFILSSVAIRKNKDSEKVLTSANTTDNTILRRPSSLTEQILSMDKNKPTVCTVTINSVEEREVFKKSLPNFNHIELADVSDMILDSGIRGGRWMENACNNKIQCDVLVLSGHFAGTFFGVESELRLPAETLEQMSCNSACEGIIKNPKEVFLFGCNTLAGKNPDARNPEEYIRILVADGFSVLEAQQIAALRYSPVGSSFYDRMSRIFPDALKLYGFSSKGPSGKNVKKYLENYFSKIPDYTTHLQKLNKNIMNEAWSSALKATAQAQTSGKSMKVNFCPIYDKNLSRVEKLKLIKGIIFNDEQLLENVPLVSKFVESELNAKDSTSSQTPEELSIISSVRDNVKLKDAIQKFLTNKTPGMMRVQISMLNIARYFKFWSDSYLDQIQRQLIGDLRVHSGAERFETIALQGVILHGLKLEDFPESNWNKWDMAVMALLKPMDIRISEQLTDYFNNKELAEHALRTVTLLGLSNANIIKSIINHIEPLTKDLEKIRNDGVYDQVFEFLNRTSTNHDVTQFYERFMQVVISSQLKSMPGHFFSVLNYFSLNKISNRIALDLALLGWGYGSGGRPEWYSYKYLTSNPPCNQLERIKQVEGNISSHQDFYHAFRDDSYDANMGARSKMTENFHEFELYPRIKNLCANL